MPGSTARVKVDGAREEDAGRVVPVGWRQRLESAGAGSAGFVTRMSIGPRARSAFADRTRDVVVGRDVRRPRAWTRPPRSRIASAVASRASRPRATNRDRGAFGREDFGDAAGQGPCSRRPRNATRRSSSEDSTATYFCLRYPSVLFSQSSRGGLKTSTLDRVLEGLGFVARYARNLQHLARAARRPPAFRPRQIQK